MELQIVEPLAFKVAQRATKIGNLAALVLEMTSDVAFEFVALRTAHARVRSVLVDDVGDDV